MESEEPIFASDLKLNNADCLSRIFSYLTLPDRLRVEATCKYWRKILDQTALPSSSLIVLCERSSPPVFRVSFSDKLWHVHFVSNRENGEALNDADIHATMNYRFDKLFSSYGYAIKCVNFGGSVEAAHRLEAALTEQFTPFVRPGLFRSISENAIKNLTSVSLRSLSLADGCSVELVDMVNHLSAEGRLETLCLHNLFINETQTAMCREAMMPLARCMQRLRRVGLSSIPFYLATCVGEVSSALDDGQDSSEDRLQELFIVMRQHFMVGANRPDRAYMSVLLAAESIHLEVHLQNYADTGVADAMMEAIRLAGNRLTTLDLRVWSQERGYHRDDQPQPIADLLTAFDSMSDSLRDFRLFGSEQLLNNDKFVSLIACLSTAPNLRCLSLGKVCGPFVNTFPLGNLVQLECLYLSDVPNLNDSEFSSMTSRLVNLKRLWLKEVPNVTEEPIFAIADRLEALEIGYCHKFNLRRFVESLLGNIYRFINPDETVVLPLELPLIVPGSLEFVRIRGCNVGTKYIKDSARMLKLHGIRVTLNKFRRAAKFILKNYAVWSNIDSIRLPWYNCPYCDAETGAN